MGTSSECIDLSQGVKESTFSSPLKDPSFNSIPSPSNTPTLISPIPIRAQNVDANDQRTSLETINNYSSADEDSESIYSTVFKISNIIGKKRRSEFESIDTRTSVQAEFQKLIDVELAG